MIRFNLTCENDHRFESWFASNAAYDTLHATGHVTCPQCGTAQVSKALMTPAVRPGRKAAAVPDQAPPAAPAPAPEKTPSRTVMAAPPPEVAQKLAALRAHIEANADYVGTRFADEARRMHLGDAPERAIYGDAKPEEVRELLEDGVPIAPLPFIPKAKTN